MDELAFAGMGGLDLALNPQLSQFWVCREEQFNFVRLFEVARHHSFLNNYNYEAFKNHAAQLDLGFEAHEVTTDDGYILGVHRIFK
mmetsp:Transcript_5562/g.9535  ORF Transcript_5562/g.9535 Transcript_5562/m.9535 type:complete len:86 (+) Transcript_5562:72-329(+)